MTLTRAFHGVREQEHFLWLGNGVKRPACLSVCRLAHLSCSRSPHKIDTRTLYSPVSQTASTLGSCSYISAIHLPPRAPDDQPMGNEWIPPITAAHWWNGLQQLMLAQWQKMTRPRWSLRAGGLGAGLSSPPPPYRRCRHHGPASACTAASLLNRQAAVLRRTRALKKKREIVGWELYFASGYPERERREEKRGLVWERSKWIEWQLW
jgi:hypothetical protein